MSIVLIGLLGYSQVTSVGEFRVADATTAFGVNLPLGTKVYNIATGDYWVATAGVVSTATLSTASASFSLLNDAGTDDQTAGEVGVTAAGNLASVNVQSALEELQGDIDQNTIDIGTNATNIANNASAIAAIEPNVSTDLSLGTVTATTMDVNSSDGTNATLIAATTEYAGLLTAAKWNEIEANNAKETNVSTALSKGTVDETTYGINSDGGNDDLILAAATSSTAGVMTAAQFIKLDGIEAGAQVNLTMITEKFEEDDGTATTHSLTQTAITTQGAIVTINGVTLSPANYTLASTTLTLGVPVYQYDQVVISYFY